VPTHIFLPKFGKEDLSKGNLAKKAVGAILVTVGIILIND